MRIHLIRHGDPHYPTDSLTARGRKEAEALADYLKGQPIDRIYSSPLGRAQETAQYTAKALSLSVEIETWTRELDDLRITQHDLMAWDLHGNFLRETGRKLPRGSWHEQEDLSSVPVRECLDHIATASDAFLARHGYEREHEAHRYRVRHRSEETIALFCHGGFGLSWLAHLLEIDPPLVWAGFFLHTSSITTILWDEREEGWAMPRCLWVGALPHLALAGLEPSQAGIKANYR